MVSISQPIYLICVEFYREWGTSNSDFQEQYAQPAMPI